MQILVSLTFFLCLGAQATPVNWVHFPKQNPWTFEPGEVRYGNHFNVDPSVIDALIERSNTELRPSARMAVAARNIQKAYYSPAQSAVLLRDCLDAIHAIEPRWFAVDFDYGNAVGFTGGYVEGEYFALVISLRDGRMYRGGLKCAEMVAQDWRPDLSNSHRWRLLSVGG